MQSRRQAFTLIELLVVVGIIALLVAMLVPAVGAARAAANRGKALAEAKALEAALRAYMNEYARFPRGLVPGQDGAGSNIELNARGIEAKVNVVKMLRGGPTENARSRVFMEISEASINETGDFVDPWDQPYKYMCDYNADNTVLVQFSSGSTNLPGRTVAVWSKGANTRDASPEDRLDDIVSW